MDLLVDGFPAMNGWAIFKVAQRAEHPDYEPDLNFKKAKTEANATLGGTMSFENSPEL